MLHEKYSLIYMANREGSSPGISIIEALKDYVDLPALLQSADGLRSWVKPITNVAMLLDLSPGPTGESPRWRLASTSRIAMCLTSSQNSAS